MTKAWDKGEHEGCGIDSQRTFEQHTRDAKMTNDELLQWAAEARKVARLGGPQHALWDLIFEAEALASGERTLLNREMVERDIEKLRGPSK